MIGEVIAKKQLRTSAKARFNYSGLRHLLDDDVRIRVLEEKPPRIRLERLLLRAETADQARVSLEAYRGSTGEYERFDFGPAAVFKANAERAVSRPFKRVDDPVGLKYRLKVTSDVTGCLIAEIDGINPVADDPGSPKEFIKVRFHPLGGEVWRVSVEDGGAFIDIEKSLKDQGIYLHDDVRFRALAYPIALRVVAQRLYCDHEPRQTEWGKMAVTFLTSLAPAFADLDEDPEPERLDPVIAQAATAFANRHNFLEGVKKSFSQEGVGK